MVSWSILPTAPATASCIVLPRPVLPLLHLAFPCGPLCQEKSSLSLPTTFLTRGLEDVTNASLQRGR
jgi:hypothetical protein